MITLFRGSVLLLLTLFTVQAQVRFDANFESGNILGVSTTDSVTYTVTTRQDIGGRWFYFRMTGVKNRFLRVKVPTSDVKRAVYSYDNITFERFTAAESPATNTFEKTYSRDTVYAAYYIPYTLTYLRSRLREWAQDSRVRIDTIGYTARSLPLFEVKVTDQTVPDSLKDHIWIHARTHPGETPSSWQFEGIVATLLRRAQPTQHYLTRLVFHLIPFTNTDGVYYGRSRTNYDGVDVESNWALADSATSREVLLLKQRMRQYTSIEPFRVFLNLHSQAVPSCTFWIHTAASTTSRFYRQQLQFCNLNTSDNPYFQQSDYSFSALAPRYPEGWLWANHTDSVMALTYETPYDNYSPGTLVSLQNLAYLGERTVYSIGEYLRLDHPARLVMDNPAAAGFWNTDTSGTGYFGENYLTAAGNSGAGNITYSSGILPGGQYTVSGWWPSAGAYATDARISVSTTTNTLRKVVNQRENGGRWNELGSVMLQNTGNITVTISDSGNGLIAADAFRVVYTGPAVSSREHNAPVSFVLHQNFPNPFNAVTIIRYELLKAGETQLELFNSVGELVAVPVSEYQLQGSYEVPFNGTELPSGVYYYRLRSGKQTAARGMVLLK